MAEYLFGSRLDRIRLDISCWPIVAGECEAKWIIAP